MATRGGRFRSAGARGALRLLLIAGGVGGAALLVEVALQGFRLALGPEAIADARRTAHPGRKSVLCVGDSHTYGLGVQRALQSYPVRLEVLLNGGRRDGEFAVENLGIPGNNTALVADQLERELAARHWDLVVVLAGYNDEWNLTEPARAGERPAGPGDARLLLPQFARWLRFCLRGGETQRDPRDQLGRDEAGMYIERPDGTRQRVNDAPDSRPGLVTGVALSKQVETALLGMVETCRRAGAPILLQTYACRYNDVFEAASAGARLAAARGGVPLVDQALWFEANGQGVDPRVLFQQDGHPTGTGYDLMARAIHAKLIELKGAHGAPFDRWEIAPSEGGGSAVPARTAAGRPLVVTPIAGGGTQSILRFALEGPAGGTWQLFFARAAAEGADVLGLVPDELFLRSRGADGTSGTFAADGRAQAWAALDLFGTPRPPEVRGQLLLLDAYASDPAATLVAGSDVIVVALPRP